MPYVSESAHADMLRKLHKQQEALDEIGRVAMACWMDMQGRLVDDEHRRVHGVLGSIARTAAAALPKTDH